MGTEDRELREGFERWVDERIHATISNLTSPLEKRIRALKRRVDSLRDRFQTLSHHMDSIHTRPKENRSNRKAGGEPRK